MRWAIEEHFHDVNEVWGAGQQQVRNIWSNIGCWNLNGWVFTLVELCCWDMGKSELSDRSHRPWDNADRRMPTAGVRFPEKCWENNSSPLCLRPLTIQN